MRTPSETVLILDDSPAIAKTWANWILEKFRIEAEVVSPRDNWSRILEQRQPRLLLLDATSPLIPVDQVCDLLSGSPRLKQTLVMLTCGFAEGMDAKLLQLTGRMPRRAIVLRKPVSQQEFINQCEELFLLRFEMHENNGTKTSVNDMKIFIGDNSAAPASNRFGWLAQEPTIMSFSVAQPNGAIESTGGKDCGDLPQGGAYFRDLAKKIGAELGLDRLQELHAGCDGCRLLSMVLPSGHVVDVLGQVDADLTSIARALRESR
ncbi:MAG: hypothetical protein ACK4UN_09050 [Limisphaerales bacterium]